MVAGFLIMKLNPKAILFDMDGVIIDNAPYNKQAWKKVLGKYGFKLTEEDYKTKVAGRPTKVIVKTFFPDKDERY